jgi:2-methylisocitrate lyase-like PEP mutase family enzyme
VRRITRVLPVPLSVDIEDGYSERADDVADLAVEIQRAGAVGINLEDGNAPSERLVEKICAIRSRIGSTELFINARTDVYLRALAQGPNAISMVTDRAEAYAKAGADGLFVPGLVDPLETTQIASATKLPLNLMALPGLPATQILHQAGLRRLSAGPAMFLSAYASVARDTQSFLAGQTEPMFSNTMGFASVEELFTQR